ncbi:hypothetical protein CKA32_005367 [Geitlerinema sp. FC II]|nr:hypothetical protein CKA32_005367 [Geitlerinema sp. FC II]
MFGFGKKKEKDGQPSQPTQSQSIHGSVSGQVGQAGRDLTQVQQDTNSLSNQDLSVAEIVDILDKLVEIVRSSELTEADKQKAVSRLHSAKAEAAEENPDKGNIAGNLRRVVESAKSVKATYDLLHPFLDPLAQWLGFNNTDFV